MKPEERLIVALDVDNRIEALELVDELGDTVSFYKIGWQLFMKESFSAVTVIASLNKKVFLDLKLDDIPNTVRAAINNIMWNVDFFSLRGDLDTYQAAKAGKPNIKFLSVPSLSSQRKEGFNLEYISEMDGVVASGPAVGTIRIACPDVIIVTPGIRRAQDSQDDHKRSLTPTQAIKEGADYIVVGRPIRNARNPKKEAKSIIQEIKDAIN